MAVDDAAPPEVPDAAVRDLRRRLELYRPVPLVPGDGWRLGVPGAYLGALLDHWRTEYDWRVHEKRIRDHPWAVAGRERPLRVIHLSRDPDAATVVLLHGWPDSVLRFERLLPALDDVNVVVPALPGFPFALPVDEGGLSADEMAAAVVEAVTDLGHARFVVSAGDIGTNVAEAMAGAYPEQVAALHLVDVSAVHATVERDALSDAERAYLERVREWDAAEGGYSHEQATKPHTLAVGLGDSPAGLAAWIVEKLYRWSDCDGDVESVFSRDEILTWVSAYWFSGAVGTSFAPYSTETRSRDGRLATPTVFTIFPKEPLVAPREFAERLFDVRGWHEAGSGGHFSAWERPDEYLRGVRDALALLGPPGRQEAGGRRVGH